MKTLIFILALTLGSCACGMKKADCKTAFQVRRYASGLDTTRLSKQVKEDLKRELREADIFLAQAAADCLSRAQASLRDSDFCIKDIQTYGEHNIKELNNALAVLACVKQHAALLGNQLASIKEQLKKD